MVNNNNRAEQKINRGGSSIRLSRSLSLICCPPLAPSLAQQSFNYSRKLGGDF